MFFQLFLKDIILDFVRFPVWWYTAGFVDVLRWARGAIAAHEATIGLRIWIKNLLVPMYGQYDWKGRIISFIFRILILFLRLTFMLLWTLLIIASIVLYLAWPIGAVASFIIMYRLP